MLLPIKANQISSFAGFCRFLVLLVCAFAGWDGETAFADDSPPPVPREFRGLWVATVNNIDWPSKPGLGAQQQKEELIALLDAAAALHLNAVIFQVRSSCDALYDSKIEPWSEYLTGRMGQAPSPFYDPLAFAIAEAHKRALELHAWFNPYRVRSRDQNTPAAPGHVSLRHPEWVRPYGKYLWLDPTEQGVRDYSLSVIMDVVRRYDIDGVHFDDYFYPYPEKLNTPGEGKDIEFPDDASWRRYQAQGGNLSRGDWRRDNVNQFVEAVYRSIKKEKPWVKFGISPFGIWRPGNPPQITGFDAFDNLYCDSRKWLADGWLDYIAPQLYWPIDQKAQSFPVLLQWWNAQNPRHRNIWPGMKTGGWKGVSDDAAEVGREIALTRSQDGAPGVILWHAKPLMRDDAGVAHALEKSIYAAPALVPAYPWLSEVVPPRPFLSVRPERVQLKLEWKSSGGASWQWVVQKKIGGKWAAEILPEEKTSETIKADLPEAVAVTAVNRFGNMSPPTTYHAGH
jgi:uncharacterized lipoprotein YddW (UPF0748 family)